MTKPNQILEHLLRSVVSMVGRKTDKPEIELTQEPPEFKLRVNPIDQGRFIGKNGIVIYSIQSIFWWAGAAQTGRPYGVKLLPNDGVARAAMPFRPNKNWDRKKLRDFIELVLTVCFKNQFPPWALTDAGDVEAILSIQLEKYLKTSMNEPNFEEAISTLIHSAGMSEGVKIKVGVTWK